MLTSEEAGKELRLLRKRYGASFVGDAAYCASVVKDSLMPKYPIEAPLLGDGAVRGVCQRLATVRKRTAKRELPIILADYVRASGQSADTGSWVVRAWAASWGLSATLGPSGPVPPIPPPAPYPTPAPPVPPPAVTPPLPTPKPPAKRHPLRGFLALLVVAAAIFGTVTTLRKGATPRPQEPTRTHRTHTPARPTPPLPATQPDVSPESVPSVRLTISRTEITFNGATLSDSQLRAALRGVAAVNDKCPVEILFDRKADPRVLEDLKTLCRKSGLRKLYVTRCDIE